MEKFAEWISSKFEHFIALLFIFGALLVVLGVSNGLNVPVLNQLAAVPNFRWACFVLGVVCLIGSVIIYLFISYYPPKVDDANVHKYSGTWTVHTTFSRWRRRDIEMPDSVSFDGKTLLLIPINGEGGSGVQIGKLNVRVGNYRATYEIVNEVQRAYVDTSGTLRMQVQVIQRQLIEEVALPPKGAHAKDPYADLRGDLQNRWFHSVLFVADTPSQDTYIQLEGRHTHDETQVDQIAKEKYTHAGLFDPPGLAH